MPFSSPLVAPLMLGAAPPKRVGDVGSFKKVPTRAPLAHTATVHSCPPSPWGSLRESEGEQLGVLDRQTRQMPFCPLGVRKLAEQQ